VASSDSESCGHCPPRRRRGRITLSWGSPMPVALTSSGHRSVNDAPLNLDATFNRLRHGAARLVLGESVNGRGHACIWRLRRRRRSKGDQVLRKGGMMSTFTLAYELRSCSTGTDGRVIYNARSNRFITDDASGEVEVPLFMRSRRPWMQHGKWCFNFLPQLSGSPTALNPRVSGDWRRTT
jgi:hypothetical protein